MNTVWRFLRRLFSAPFHLALVISFTLVAAVTIGIGSWVISRTIHDYLTETMNERIARNAFLAQAIYQANLRHTASLAHRLAHDTFVQARLQHPEQWDENTRQLIQTHFTVLLTDPMIEIQYLVAVLDKKGNLMAAQVGAPNGQSDLIHGGNWSSLPVVRTALETGQSISSTEIIPVELLTLVNLDQQARIELQETPKAAPNIFDPREGSAGLAIVSIAPIRETTGKLNGLALVLHLFNNDFALVDQIKTLAQIDTVTIFLGDLRISTNVLNDAGQRAVGTRLAAEVGEVVLKQGREYVGTAFVVKENYITHYEPLRNHAGQIVGILYVGVRQAWFLRLLDQVEQRITLTALVMVLATFLLATPVTRVITDPLKNLREMAQVSKRVAQGETDVRLPGSYGGEVGQLAAEFNAMLDTLQATREQLVHSENLASLGQLAAGVAHELNNPLGTILLYAESAERECAEDDARRADLAMIIKETKRCKRIVADLLNFSRQHQVIAHPTDVNALLQELVEMAPRRIKTVTIPIVTDFDRTLPLIEGDSAQLRQVFLNILTNAVEAMPNGGTLTIRTRHESADKVTIEIQDTGVGIPPENLGKLFTPFFTTKPIGKGTGLGLAISYGIVKMHRGQIQVKSQVGQGTTFTIQLPVKLPKTESAFGTASYAAKNGQMIG
ncbi:MAG: hypothetical protein DDG60_08060 [Anaerolineae bacterium]|nr:MAG: hypothetical protein DDG60_08060 [Anaerolineae bacterium]